MLTGMPDSVYAGRRTPQLRSQTRGVALGHGASAGAWRPHLDDGPQYADHANAFTSPTYGGCRE